MPLNRQSNASVVASSSSFSSSCPSPTSTSSSRSFVASRNAAFLASFRQSTHLPSVPSSFVAPSSSHNRHLLRRSGPTSNLVDSTGSGSGSSTGNGNVAALLNRSQYPSASASSFESISSWNSSYSCPSSSFDLYSSSSYDPSVYSSPISPYASSTPPSSPSPFAALSPRRGSSSTNPVANNANLVRRIHSHESNSLTISAPSNDIPTLSQLSTLPPSTLNHDFSFFSSSNNPTPVIPPTPTSLFPTGSSLLAKRRTLRSARLSSSNSFSSANCSSSSTLSFSSSRSLSSFSFPSSSSSTSSFSSSTSTGPSYESLAPSSSCYPSLTSPRLRTRCYTPSTRTSHFVTAEWLHSPLPSLSPSPKASPLIMPARLPSSLRLSDRISSNNSDIVSDAALSSLLSTSCETESETDGESSISLDSNGGLCGGRGSESGSENEMGDTSPSVKQITEKVKSFGNFVPKSVTEQTTVKPCDFSLVTSPLSVPCSILLTESPLDLGAFVAMEPAS